MGEKRVNWNRAFCHYTALLITQGVGTWPELEHAPDRVTQQLQRSFITSIPVPYADTILAKPGAYDRAADAAAVELSSNERQQHVFPHPAAVAFTHAKVQLAAQAIGIIFPQRLHSVLEYLQVARGWQVVGADGMVVQCPELLHTVHHTEHLQVLAVAILAAHRWPSNEPECPGLRQSMVCGRDAPEIIFKRFV